MSVWEHMSHVNIWQVTFPLVSIKGRTISGIQEILFLRPFIGPFRVHPLPAELQEWVWQGIFLEEAYYQQQRNTRQLVPVNYFHKVGQNGVRNASLRYRLVREDMFIPVTRECRNIDPKVSGKGALILHDETFCLQVSDCFVDWLLKWWWNIPYLMKKTNMNFTQKKRH